MDSSSSCVLSETPSYMEEKFDSPSPQDGASSRWAVLFGGPNVRVGPRIDSTTDVTTDGFHTNTNGSDKDGDGRSQDAKSDLGSTIEYRSCSWTKTAALLLAQYIGLAIMCFPAAFSELGWVGGMVATVLNAAFYQYTSFILWEFCLRHPEVRDICDIGCMLMGGKKWAWWVTAIMFVLNNTCVMGLHIVVGSQFLNTAAVKVTIHVCRTVLFCFVIAVLCWLCSLARTFDMLSRLATVSAAMCFVSVIQAAVFAAVQDRPANYDPKGSYMAGDGTILVRGSATFSAWPALHSTFTSIMVAILSISYTFIGQISLPSYIAEMKNPRDFPKALWTSITAEVLLFTGVGITIYKATGTEYMTSPAFGGLQYKFKMISFSFLFPSIIFIGALYASITARFVFFRLFQNSKHMSSHTIKGWVSWGGILMIIWAMAFIVSQVVPFFSALLALVGSIFDAFFGFVFWAVAWFRMRAADKRAGRTVRNKQLDLILRVLNVIILVVGFGVFLVAGTIASALYIKEQFDRGHITTVFSCASNAL